MSGDVWLPGDHLLRRGQNGDNDLLAKLLIFKGDVRKKNITFKLHCVAFFFGGGTNCKVKLFFFDFASRIPNFGGFVLKFKI